MSVGIAGFQTGVMIAKQAASGTLATTGFMLLPAEDADTLSPGQSYINRRPTYGNRTQQSGMHTRDYTMPGGDLPGWALGMDGTSLELLHLCRMFFQNYTITSGTAQIGSHAWEFTPRSSNPGAIGDYDLYTASVATGLGISTKNPRYRDCIAVAQAGGWSAGGALTLKNTVQSMDVSFGGTPSGWGNAPNSLAVIGASALCVTASANGTDYTVYPSSVSWNLQYETEDIPGACTNRARFTLGDFSGEASMTLPRNSDLFALLETHNDSVGTIALAFRPSGTYSTGASGTYTSDLILYGKFLRGEFPAGPVTDVTHDLQLHVQDAVWTTYSDLGSAAI